MSINRVTVTGNLTRDPELKTTQGGTAVLNIGMTIVTGSGIAAALIGSVLDDEVDAETAIKAYDDALESITLHAEILDIERGN